jgi:hypothetical protein
MVCTVSFGNSSVSLQANCTCKKFTKFIINEINKDNLIREKFYKKTKNRKYTCKQLCYSLFYLFKSGSSFRKFDDNTQYIKIFNKNLKYKLPNWNTIYKFYIKLIKYDIICKTFIETTKKIKKSKYYIVDTTLICNKGGIDNVGYNIQLPKHKTTKISIISNENKILDVQLFSGNLNDAGILDKQLNIFNNFQPNSNNILLGDSGYDSNNIRNKLKNMKFGKLLTYKNKRNTKDKKKLNNIKLSNKEILILKNKRIKIEHINAKLKNYKKIIIRYDKKTINYLNTVYLFSILLNLG